MNKYPLDDYETEEDRKFLDEITDKLMEIAKKNEKEKDEDEDK